MEKLQELISKKEEKIDEEVLVISEYASMFIDIVVIMYSIYVLRVIRRGPTFLMEIVCLAAAACLIDLVVNLCSLTVHWPSEIVEVMLYSLAGLAVFTDVMVYWSLAFLYWVTSRNM